jgi:hypothetical protein
MESSRQGTQLQQQGFCITTFPQPQVKCCKKQGCTVDPHWFNADPAFAIFALLDPDPDPAAQINADPCHKQI